MRIEERETLSLGLVHGQPLRTMATGMGRAFSMVSREHARYAAKGRPFRAGTAHHLAAARADATTNPDVLFFSSIFSKTQYSTDVVSKACEPGWFSCGHLMMPLSQPMMR